MMRDRYCVIVSFAFFYFGGKMENLRVVLLIVGIVFLVFVLLRYGFAFLYKKGVDVSGALDVAENSVDAADKIVDALISVVPENYYLKIIDRVIDWAKEAVQRSEQLYKISAIEEDQRKGEAEKYIYEILALSKIEITPELKKIVDGSIEAAVFALPKTSETISQ
jgi:hypothetical protein